MRKRKDPKVRFDLKWQLTPEGCHQWTGAVIKNWGYGCFNSGGARGPVVPSHRWAYAHRHGPIPKGIQIHHTCENKLCVNPDHLEALTLDEHNLRHGKSWGINKNKTHCKRGHPFDEENTYRYKGQRHCKKCGSIRARAHNQKKYG